MKLNLIPALAGLLLLVGGAALADAAKKAPLPLVVYAESGGDMPFIASGYMGNTGAIKMDAQWTGNPHAGKTCLKVDYTASDNWGGVVWQNPDNNWGEKAGGLDLTGAKNLTFWARGDKGGEVVSFSFGLIGSDKPFHDTGKGKLENVVLTKAWQQYTINVRDQDMSRIVTGFVWTLGSKGTPVTFYLDDIKYQ